MSVYDIDNYPLPGFHFQVDFLFSAKNKAKFLAVEEAGFMEISGIKASMEFGQKSKKSKHEPEDTSSYMELGSIGNPHKFPTGRVFENLILKRGMTYSSKLARWFESSLYKLQITPVPVLISVLNDGGTKDQRHKPVISWLFYDAYPVSWEYAGFDAMKSQYLIETIELHYSYFIVLNTRSVTNFSSVQTLFQARQTKDIIEIKK